MTAPSPPQVERPSGNYTTPLAPTWEEVSACVSCGLCLPHCPTFRITGREVASPRGRIAAMTAVLEGTAEIDEAFDDALSFCCGCRACEAVCPGLVPYGRMLEGARAELVKGRPTLGRRLRSFLLGRVLPNRRIVAIATLAAALAQRFGLSRVLPGSLGRGLRGLRPLDLGRRSQLGRVADPASEPRGTVALLAGCVMDAWFPQVHAATVAVLQRAGFRVVVPGGQTCCGALAAHDGHAEAAAKLASQNISAFAEADLVVSNSAGCTAHLKGYGHWSGGGAELAAKTRDVTELIAQLIDEGALARLQGQRGRVAVQDPCHLRHAQRLVAPQRLILQAAGYRTVEIDEDGLCCGAAGIYSLLEPEAAAELGRRKATAIEGTGTDLVASANPGCEMQLRSLLRSRFRVAHPVELYAEALDEELGGDPRRRVGNR